MSVAWRVILYGAGAGSVTMFLLGLMRIVPRDVAGGTIAVAALVAVWAVRKLESRGGPR